MATTTASKSKSLAKSTGPDPSVNEGNWPAMKLTILGLVTLAIAFAFLFLISPNGNPH